MATTILAISFDPSINLGTIIAAAAVIITIIKMHSSIVELITEIRVKVDAMWEEYVRDKNNG